MDGEERMVVEKLVIWLEGEAKHRYGAARTHDLHLWDWEVDGLLNALRGAPHVKPDYTFGSVGTPTMRDLENWRGDPYGLERKER